MYLCGITQCSQSQPPERIKGSILCDEMGLGKTLQTLGLILLAPPPGVEYKSAKISSGDEPIIPTPPELVIKNAKVASLKGILKAAGLKSSGKKDDLIKRVLDGKQSNDIMGEHFPVSMRPVVGSTNRCTLIVSPVSVMSNWQSQVNDHVKEGVLSMRVYHGQNRTEMLPDIQSGAVDILLASYHTLAAEYKNIFGKDDDGDGKDPSPKRSRKASIFDIKFHRIVLDEAVSLF